MTDGEKNLRKIIVACVNAIDNGSCASEKSSIDFLSHVPEEIALTMTQLRALLSRAADALDCDVASPDDLDQPALVRELRKASK